MNNRIEYLREKTKTLTTMPGCYIMRDSKGEIIYIGKAKNLKNRVTSYFRKSADHLPKVAKMVSNVYDYDYIVTESEFEALVLECSLIKQYMPKYNILLKDDKGYHYIKITSDKWGRIKAAKQHIDDGATYIGPYTGSYAVKQAVEEANTAFRLPTCSRVFPRDFKKERPCLNFHIKRCMGVCRGCISEQEYAETIAQAIDFIRSDSANTIKLLTEKMEEAAENLEFEKAARLRDRIAAINKINENQKVIYTDTPEEDVVAVMRSENQTCATLIKFRGGKLVDKASFMLGSTDDVNETRSEFLLRYYSSSQDIPKRIVIDEEIPEQELVERYIAEKAGKKVTLSVPKRGEQVKLIEMARSNCAEQLSQQTKADGRDVAALDELAGLLGLSHTPQYIEAYDISNIGSSSMVAGMVVFENAKPLKSAYKRFAIKEQTGQNDYAAMSEVISRRIARYFEEKKTGTGFGRLPDLILLDGGRGHVATIAPIIEASGLDIPLYGMVKDDKHRTRAIATNGGEISVASHKSAFMLLVKIQNEVHRFSIEYQRKKHKKTNLESELLTIGGIGEKRMQALFKRFKTVKAMREAGVDELKTAEGITEAAAQAVYNHFHG